MATPVPKPKWFLKLRVEPISVFSFCIKYRHDVHHSTGIVQKRCMDVWTYGLKNDTNKRITSFL
ncbi:hypothetical protein KC19_4G011700 [Ceratodon purpureus]|uniref:Uncharacterized protein n=1 Tax=Ceratodon purpureus TaxID=3225 RepID=A0A8T0I6H0_CERPU|nr:hypothetical protein KC19_4G011700 [Ceratodon purpureus]